MKLESRVFLRALVLASLLWSGAASAAEPSAPLAVACTRIKTVSQLQAMQNNLSGTYCLDNDINAGSIANFVPVGTTTPFTGRFYGYGHAITGLRISSAGSNVGLFGLADNAVIQDVNLIDVRVVVGTGANVTVGGLVGNASASTIARVHVAGQVKCTASNCFSGGIAGATSGAGIIDGSSSSASVQSTNYAAGAVGYLTGNTITRTYATGPVTCTATNCFAGGLVGRTNGGAVNLSFATGTVIAADGSDSRAGGLIALTEAATSISRSYATGTVRGGASGLIAALIGQHNSGGPIDQTFTVGRVLSSGATAGGLTASAGGTPVITNSYWDTQTTRQSTSGAGTGMTTAQLRGALPTGFDNAWALTVNRSYPFLNDFDVDFASTLATLVRANKVFTFLPISQLDTSQYATAPAHADGAALATVYTMIARGIGVTNNVPALKNAMIDQPFWDDATQTTTWQGPVTTYATLGTFTAIPGGTPLGLANVIGAMTPSQLVILRGLYRKSDGTNAAHWLLGTLFTRDTDNRVSAVVAHDPMTGLQVEIDPTTKKVLSENFPFPSFRVNGYQPVTLN